MSKYANIQFRLCTRQQWRVDHETPPVLATLNCKLLSEGDQQEFARLLSKGHNNRMVRWNYENDSTGYYVQGITTPAFSTVSLED